MPSTRKSAVSLRTVAFGGISCSASSSTSDEASLGDFDEGPDGEKVPKTAEKGDLRALTRDMIARIRDGWRFAIDLVVLYARR